MWVRLGSLVLALAGCSASSDKPSTRSVSGDPPVAPHRSPVAHDAASDATPSDADVPKPTSAAVWAVADRHAICISASHTIDLDPGHPPSVRPALGCRAWPEMQPALDYVQGHAWCGPCGFDLDEQTSINQRKSHPDACCYVVTSPPSPRQ